MNLPFFIARRYLFAKKSHNVINKISAISAVAMAVGTAALIIILSVYNGFDALIKSTSTVLEPDLLIVPSRGKLFVPGGKGFDWIKACPDVRSVCAVLQDNVVVSYEDRMETAVVKGVDRIYEEETPLRDYIRDGKFCLHKEERTYAVVGMGLAGKLGLDVRFVAGMDLYFPDREARVSVLNPMSAVNTVTVWPSGVFSVRPEIDDRTVVVPRELMCELLGCTDEVSAVELRFALGVGSRQQKKLQKTISEYLGDDFQVLNRAQQNPSVYKMLRYEKASVYLIMIFIVLILGFSIFGNLSMLIIEKRHDIAILGAMGARKKTVRRIFTLEGWLITFSGMVVGLVAGIAFCLLQQHFGIIKMPGNYIVDAYPVILQLSDVVVSVLSISLLGYLIALIPSRQS